MPLWYPPILAYHRVAPSGGTDTPTVSPEIFERQMEILAGQRRPSSLDELAARMEQGSRFDRRAVVVTFDDGTDDLYHHAYPILAKYRIPAIIFLIVSNIGKQGNLHPDQIRRMSEDGIRFGSHTLNHAYLPSLPAEQARQEIFQSKEELKNLGITPDFLSYPAGGYTREITQMAQEAGYRGACTTNRGETRFPINRWALRRIKITPAASTPLVLRILCCGYYGLNKKLRPPC